MADTRKTRVPMVEQIRLINECRQSGMTDADWCHENDIAVSTFYNWVSRCRKTAADQIPAANYGHLEVPRPKQDVVPIDIVPDHIPEQHTASQMLNSNLDNPHTIEVSMKDITVRISNDADPVMDFSLLSPLEFFVDPKNGDGRNNKPPAMRVRVDCYTKKLPFRLQ